MSASARAWRASGPATSPTATSASTAPIGADALAYVYILAGESGHSVHACDGELSAAIASHDAAAGRAVVLIWAEAVTDISTARALVPKIDALDDARYAMLIRGEVSLEEV